MPVMVATRIGWNRAWDHHPSGDWNPRSRGQSAGHTNQRTHRPWAAGTRFNAGTLIKLKKAPCQIAQRILSKVETAVLIRRPRPPGVRSNLLRRTARQVIRRDSGEAQLETPSGLRCADRDLRRRST